MSHQPPRLDPAHTARSTTTRSPLLHQANTEISPHKPDDSRTHSRYPASTSTITSPTAMISVTTPTNTPITSPLTTPRDRSTTPSPSPHTIHTPRQPRARTPVSAPRTPPKQIVTPSTTAPPPAPHKPNNGVIPFGAESVKFIKKHQLRWDFHPVLAEVQNGSVGSGREVKKREATGTASPAVKRDLADKRSAATDTRSEKKIRANKDFGAEEEPGKKSPTLKISSRETRGSNTSKAATIEKVLEWRKGVEAGMPVEMKVVCSKVMGVTKAEVKVKMQSAGMKEVVEGKQESVDAWELVKGNLPKQDYGKRKARGSNGVEPFLAVTNGGCAV